MVIGRPSNTTCYDWISLVEGVKKRAKKNSIVLEIGSSVPERTHMLVPYCRRIIGVEYFSDRIPKNFANVRYVHGDWQKLTRVISRNSVDVAVRNQVIEHVEKDVQALDELYAVLKPGGVALLSTPNRTRALQKISDLLKGRERTFPWGEHVREYTIEDAVSLVKKSRFRKYDIVPLVLGIHTGPFYCYLEKPPSFFARYANFLEFRLYK